MRLGRAGALLALLVTCFLCCAPASADDVSATLSVGAAWLPDDGFQPTEATAMAELAVLVAPADWAGASLELNVRHAFADGAFDGKRRARATLDVPVQRGASVFVRYEWAYDLDRDYCWAGMKFRL